MPILKREQLKTQLKRNQIAPVYLLFGAETFLRDNAAKWIADLNFTPGDARDFNETEFSLNTEGNLTAALAAAQQLPMMAAKRVIRVTDIRVAASAMRDTLREDDEGALAAYLKNPASSSVVMLIADELDKRRRMTKVLTDGATAVEFAALGDDELSKWARGELKKLGSEMDDRAMRLLISLVGPDVRRLTLEIQKLSTAALPDNIVSAELVELLVGDSRGISNFVFGDYVTSGRKSEALRALRKSLDEGAEPVMMVGVLSSKIRRLLMAKEAMSRGADRAEVARMAWGRYDEQQAFLATARKADERSLTTAIQRLAETDVAIKTSVGGSAPHGSRMQIEMLVAELAYLLDSRGT